MTLTIILKIISTLRITQSSSNITNISEFFPPQPPTCSNNKRFGNMYYVFSMFAFSVVLY